MTPVVYEFVADVANHSKYFIVPVPQGNVGTRYIDVLLIQNGVPYTYASGATYVCTGVNGGGHGTSVTCNLVNGKVRVPLSNAMLSYKGVGSYRVEEIVGGEIKSSFNFHVSVEEVPLAPEEIITSDDFQELADLISAVSNYTKWIIGTGVPSSSQGNNTDIYLNDANGAVYQKTSNGWVYKCTLGSTMYVAYATDSSGANFSTTYSGQPYLGLYTGQGETQPTNPSLYTWIMIAGGDNMRASDYGGTDSTTVARADSIKGEFVISNIEIPANTITATTTVVITHEAIAASSIIEGVYTNIGLNTIDQTLANGSLTLTFPASPTSGTAMVKLWNMGNYIYPLPYDWDDYDPPEAEDVNIDWSQFSV